MNIVNNLHSINFALLRIIRSEYKGQYPGGSTRRFHRYAFIGWSVFYWGKKSLFTKSFFQGLLVLILGFPMLIAAIVNKIRLHFSDKITLTMLGISGK